MNPLSFVHPSSLLGALDYLHSKANSRLIKLGIKKSEECLGKIHLALLEASHTIWLARCENFNSQDHPSSLDLRKEAVGKEYSAIQSLFKFRSLSVGNPPISEDD